MKPSLFACCLLFCFQSFAQWNPNPQVGNIVASIRGYTILQRSVSDGSGGMIIAFVNDWEDYDNGGITTRTFAVQGINENGTLKWGTADQPVLLDSSTVYMNQGPLNEAATVKLEVEPDGFGGVFIAWKDPNIALKVQHIDSSGQLLWGSTHKTISPGGLDISICRSGTGLIVGSHGSNPSTSNQTRMFAQRLNANGDLMWGAAGKQLVDMAGNRQGVLVSDGNNGASAFFNDSRNAGIGFGNDIYGQRLDSNGNRLWSDTGKAICRRFGNQEISETGNNLYDFKMNKNKAFAGDSGNAFIMFSDDRNVSNQDQLYLPNWDIYAQKISASGDILWDTSGVPITTEKGPQQPDNMVSDKKGGAVALFTSQRNYYIIQYIQRLNALGGTRMFTDSGILVSPTPTQNSDNYSAISISDSGNIFVNSSSYKASLYYQKYSSLGMPQWDSAQARNFFNTLYTVTSIMAISDTSCIISWIGNQPNNILHALKLSYASFPFKIVTSIFNGNWNDPATWSSGKVPGLDEEVIINSTVSIKADTTCYSLQVGPSGKVIVAKDVHFTVLH